MSETAAGDWEDTPDAASGLARPYVAVDPDETLRPGPAEGAEQASQPAVPPAEPGATLDNSHRGTHHITTTTPTDSPIPDNTGTPAGAKVAVAEPAASPEATSVETTKPAPAALSLAKADKPAVARPKASPGADADAETTDPGLTASGLVEPGPIASDSTGVTVAEPPAPAADGDRTVATGDLEAPAPGDETIRSADTPVGTPEAPAAVSESAQTGLDANDLDSGDPEAAGEDDPEATVVGLESGALPDPRPQLPIDDSAEINEVDRAAAIGAADGGAAFLRPGQRPQRDARKWIHVVRHGYVLRSRSGMTIAAAVVLVVLTLFGLTGLLLSNSNSPAGSGKAIVFVDTEAPTIDFASFPAVIEPPATAAPPTQAGVNAVQAQSVGRADARPRGSSANAPGSHQPQPTSPAGAPTAPTSEAAPNSPAPATSSSKSDCWTNFPAIATLLKRMGGC
ncbi:hypothetical protein I6A60_06655 [Frankia sp. AgB1.9]|uniref:hypothetical protein n=1 Tax=unclassified Frankia TaxID=2632575 RepID=UPI00193251BC|nr:MULTISPECIES: hypothetical protein [unclassified Frankia]MBL7490735.1 hypothetical protein [Frankia sp. AgW1.1]MBL7547554.1 hypothetical protein [Frankia sp. AgB1.9]MBL7622983.1 hypothetical protein [Frankia sp. AgB1.8]